ncbi:serine/threonine protein kinase [Ottowia caeni]|uniref:serine/threonine protein kinase n=1 Tax=Ottowia caeni TaxID=2870339 RepID=UPI003D734602
MVGQGGFGVVYEAWDAALERVVAIKEYMPSSLAFRHADGSVAPQSEGKSDTFQLGMRSFINEARLLAQFDHPSLLKVYRFWEDKGTAYMVMPLYRGRTLREKLASMSESPGQAWLTSLVDGVSQALQVMHGANCYHRDIAPDNIMLLEGTDLPVVLDFGAARRVITDQNQAVTVILKPGYAPVEQYGDVPDMAQGAWTDVYALAAVLHLAVSGKVPPPSIGRLLSDTYVPLAGQESLRGRFSEPFLRAIDAGLAVRPEQRPQTMLEFRRTLGLEGTDSQGRPTNPTTPRSAPSTSTGSTSNKPVLSGSTTQRPGKSATAWLGAVGVGLLLVGGSAWWLLRPTSPTNSAAAPATEATAPAPTGRVTALPGTAEPAPEPAAPAPRDAIQSLAALRHGATPGFEVTASSAKSRMQIGADRLEFQVSSNRPGHVYAFLLSSDGHMYLLFPNSIDKRNTIRPGTSLTLPRASWPLDAGGPVGTDRFAVLVSEREREFTSVGIQSDGLFPQFPLPVLAALEATRSSEATPLLGEPVCPKDSKCTDAFGVAFFEVEQY